MRYLITNWQQLKCTKWLRFPVVFDESALLPADVPNLKWKCWLWGVQETKCHKFYTTRHGKAFPFQLWWSVRGVIPTFDVHQYSLLGSMFCICLLRLGLAVTGAPAENFGTRIHGVYTRVARSVRHSETTSYPGCTVHRQRGARHAVSAVEKRRFDNSPSQMPTFKKAPSPFWLFKFFIFCVIVGDE